MAILNMAAYEADLQGLQAFFYDQLETVPADLNTMSMRVPSTAPSEMYRWMDQIGDLEDWIGNRTIEDIAVQGQALVNQPFQKAINVSKRDLSNDRLGLARVAMATLADQVQRHWWRLVVESLLDGAVRVCHDGQPFFSAAHPTVGVGVQSNLSALPFGAVNFAAQRLLMETQVGARGTPMEVRPTHIVYGPAIEAAVETVLLAQYGAGGADNLDYKRVEMIKVPRIRAGYVTRGGFTCTGNEWFLIDASHPIKPVVLQERKGVEMVWDEPFLRNEIQCGVDCEGAAGQTLYYLAQGNYAP